MSVGLSATILSATSQAIRAVTRKYFDLNTHLNNEQIADHCNPLKID